MLRHNQQLGQKQLLKLSRQQIQLLNFIQLNTLELEQKIKDEIEENPALEVEHPVADPAEPAEREAENSSEDFERFELLDQYHQDDETPEYRTAATDLRHSDQPTYTAPLVQSKDFRETLKDQLDTLPLNGRERLLAAYIVDSLDDDGYLRMDLDDMADTLSFAHNLFVEESELEAALDTVQELDPAGIGARDLRECLLLQLESHPRGEACIAIACQIVDKHLNDLANHNYEKLMHTLGISEEELTIAAALIEKLNPRPVGGNTAELVKNQNIIPEFIIEKTDNGSFRASLANNSTVELRLSSDMLETLEALRRDKSNKQNKAAVQYLRSKVDSALWFIEMVRQREQSMLKTMHALVQLQADYFRSGDPKHLRPMILKDVAEQVGLDISTISRVTSTKYALAAFGIVHLKDLFNQSMAKSNGELVTNKEISDRIARLIAEEDKENPIIDQDIAAKLAESGYIVARRTVAKYRDAMNIPVAKLRKTWKKSSS